MNDISLHLLIKNEEALLLGLLGLMRPWVNEIVVIDTGSTDRSVEIARSFTSLVVERELNHDFAAARNAGLEVATCPWILQIDADEVPTQELLNWIVVFTRLAVGHEVGAVEILRENFIDGKPIGAQTYEWHKRLFPREMRFRGRIHEQLMVGDRRVFRSPDCCKYVILHHKTQARQERQNALYEQWEEHRASCRHISGS